MKKIINAIKDFLYNITDYGLIITVIVVMVVILGWRFNILMNKGIEKEAIKDLPIHIGENEADPSSSEAPETPINEQENPNNEDPSKEPTEPPVTPEKPIENSGLIATINIPEGSFPSKIGDILMDSNLIESKEDFLDRSVELGLDTRLRSGKFDIEVGTSLDNIIKIIANAQ